MQFIFSKMMQTVIKTSHSEIINLMLANPDIAIKIVNFRRWKKFITMINNLFFGYSAG